MAAVAEIAIVECDAPQIDAGLDLLDSNDVLIRDISADLVAKGSEIAHNVYATIHGTCTLKVARSLLWGSQRVRPWMRVTDTVTGATLRKNLGVYLPIVPSRPVGSTPIEYAVRGFDKLEVLNHSYGASYSLAVGAPILAAVRALIIAAGETAILIDSTGDAKVQATARVWPLDERTFTIHIINDLLDSVGYRGLWCDLDGNYRSEPYTAPSGIAPMWTYNAQSARTIVGKDRVETADYFGVPNRWVFVRDDPAGTIPVEGTGIYTVNNLSDGPTSQTARDRVIPAVIKLDAADQASLVVQGDRVVERDKRVDRRVELVVGPHPFHGHFDVVTYVDSDLGPTASMLVNEWHLPLDSSDMSLKLKAV